MKVLGVVFAVLLFVIAIFGLTWLVQGNEFFLYQYFAPKNEAVRREVFEKSKAFNQGMIQEIQAMRFEYAKAAKEHQDALASIILHRVADFDMSQMPLDLRIFINDLKKEKENGR
jgi:hypothetical protein